MKQETYRGLEVEAYELVWEIIKHYESLGIDLLSFSEQFICGYRDGYEKAICDFKGQMEKQFEKQPDQT